MDSTEQRQVPASITSRIRRFLALRVAWMATVAVLLALATSWAIVLATLALDQAVLMPVALRVAAGVLIVLPAAAGLAGMAVWAIRRRGDARELRRLDNRDDDLRAALNLVPRLQGGDASLDPDLVRETVSRATVLGGTPLPTLRVECRRLGLAVALAAAALVGLAAWRAFAPDMHTGVSRLLHPWLDFGSVGVRHFPVVAEVWANAPVQMPGDPDMPAAPSRLAEVFFLRERLEGGAWRPNFQSMLRTWADRLAGYSPVAVVNREVALLDGDRLDLRFQAVDARRREALEDMEIVRFEEGREVKVRHLTVDRTGWVSVGSVRRDHGFMVRSGGQFSPRYRVKVVPRPTPNRLYLFQRPPAQYGKLEKEIVLRDPDRNLNLTRMSGLPGSRMSVEFDTPYGDDLDLQASFVQIGETQRQRLKRITSRNSGRKARGEKFWSFDFTLDEQTLGDVKLYLHLVTSRATFRDQPIVNAYDEPFIVQVIEDLPPMIEITQLPQRRHFASDEAFAFRYHYTDDYGVSEVGLELRAFPSRTELATVALAVRPPEASGDVRREDEMLQILDLSQFAYGFVDFAVVVKDVKGQVAKTGVVSLTMSDSAIETLLPKLTGGWWYRWDAARPETGAFMPGDLETPPAVREMAAFRDGLARLLQFQDGAALTTNELARLAAALNYRHRPFLLNDNIPYGYTARDYPYYYNRQASTWLASLAGMSGARSLAVERGLLATLATSAEPLKAQEYKELQARRAGVAALLDRANLVADVKGEIGRRVSLQRAAHFCAVVARRLAETSRLMEALQQAAGPMPESRRRGDLWETYPSWVIAQHRDPEIQQQARLVEYSIRNIDRKLELLNDELDRLLVDHREGMDSRLLAVVSMMAAAGRNVTNVDRQELAAKAVLLERFISQGALAAEVGIYREIAAEFPSCERQAVAAAGRTEAAGALAARLNELFDAVTALSRAGFRKQMGSPRAPKDRSQRWADNLASRMRSQLDELDGHADRVLRGAEFQTCSNLVAVRAHLMALHESASQVTASLASWPALEGARPLLAAADAAATNLVSAVDAMAALRSDVRVLSGFQPMFAGNGLAELTNRAWVAETGASLGALGTYDDLAEATRGVLEPVRRAQAELVRSPWLRVACGGPDGRPQEPAGGEVRAAVSGDLLALHARVADRQSGPRQSAWTNTVVEVYASRPGAGSPIRQVIFRPSGTNGTGSVEWYETGAALEAPVLDWHVRALSSGGYDLLAFIPLDMLSVDPKGGVFLFECAIESTPAGAAPQFATLFESGTSSAFLHNDRYGRMSPASGVMDAGASRLAKVAASTPDRTASLVQDAVAMWWAPPSPFTEGTGSVSGASAVLSATNGVPMPSAERSAPCRAQAARLPRLGALLTDAAGRFRTLAASLSSAGPAKRIPATQPQRGISAQSSTLFDAMAPAAILATLDADVRQAGGDEARVDGLFETATETFGNLALVSAKDSLSNPVEEYVRARAATALHLCSTSAVAPFVRTYGRSGNERKDWLRAYFRGREMPPELKAFIDGKDYGVPTLPADLAAMVKPWLDAGAAGTLDATLREQRRQRLAELLALARNAQAMQDHQEALVRVRSLSRRLTDLRETTGLMRYPADDIRNDGPWADAAEEAEGLERDLLAGRLRDIPEPVRQALRQRVHVFRRGAYAEVAGDAALSRELREYGDTLRQLEGQLMPKALDAERQLRADIPNLRRDSALVVLSTFGMLYWWERQLEAELVQKQALPQERRDDSGRLIGSPVAGSMAPAADIQAVMAMAATSWRSACNLRALEYAADPTEAAQAALLHDYAVLAAMKLLTERLYDQFPGAFEAWSRARKTTLTALTETMLQQVPVIRQVKVQVVRFLGTNAPTAGLPSRSEAVTDMMMPFEALSVLFQNERVAAEYQKAYRGVVASNEAEQVRGTIRAIRHARSSQGQFWRLLGDRLMEAVEAGVPLLDAEAAARIEPAELKKRLERQRDATRGALAYMEKMGSGLNEKELTELAVVEEMLHYDEDSLAALASKAGAAGEVIGGYQGVHESVVSYVLSLQGGLFPAELPYPVRPRWARLQSRVSSHFETGNLGADMLNSENQWLALADRERADVFRRLCEFAYAKLSGGNPSAVGIAHAFQRFMDARYRNMMPFGSPEPGATRSPLRVRQADASMPEHVGQAFINAQTIDLPDQDNRLVRKLYFEALQEEKDGTRDE